MTTSDGKTQLDVIDLCEMWLKLDYPEAERPGPATETLSEISGDTPPDPVESRYRPHAPHMQGA